MWQKNTYAQKFSKCTKASGGPWIKESNTWENWLEDLFSDDNQDTKSPDIVKCTMMWLRLTQFWLQMYTPAIATLQWKEKDET